MVAENAITVRIAVLMSERTSQDPLGILGNAEMRETKMKCHELFDHKWKNEKTSKKRHIARKKAYADLAAKLNIPIEECYFGYFDMDMLNKVYEILKGGVEI